MKRGPGDWGPLLFCNLEDALRSDMGSARSFSTSEVTSCLRAWRPSGLAGPADPAWTSRARPTRPTMKEGWCRREDASALAGLGAATPTTEGEGHIEFCKVGLGKGSVKSKLGGGGTGIPVGSDDVI